MREILFRGMTIREKWVYGNLIKTDKGYLINHSLDFATKVSPNDKYAFALFEDEISAVSKNTIGQYTGLKDKNGKMIFEGDIIRSTFDYKETNEVIIGVVEVDKYNPCFVIHYKYNGNKHDCYEYDFIQCYLRTNEVIGNIHDNPELITNPK